MIKKIYVTRRIDETGINLLRKKYSVFMSFKHTSPSKKEILKRVKNVHAIVCTLSERIDSDVMDAAGDNLRVISTFSTGYEHIDVDEATKRGIYVTNTGDILSEATADLTFAFILASLIDWISIITEGPFASRQASILFCVLLTKLRITHSM